MLKVEKKNKMIKPVENPTSETHDSLVNLIVAVL